jgi:ubiquinol-cytochrome c reductase cytochrome b subunit
MLVLVNQIVTGIFLTMHFKPSAAEAFASVEYIMRDVEWGWLIRYMHSTGASLFFVVVYLHMFRGLMYGSYQKPRELVWILGMLIYLVLMAEAFLGYVLPWGQMSYWGAQGDHLLFGAIPGHRQRPDRVDHGRLPALRRHAEPLLRAARDRAAAGAVAAGGAAPVRAARSRLQQPRRRRDQEGRRATAGPPRRRRRAFHPYYTVKDLFYVGCFLIIAAFIIFFAPAFGGWFLEHDNFTEANPW